VVILILLMVDRRDDHSLIRHEYRVDLRRLSRSIFLTDQGEISSTLKEGQVPKKDVKTSGVCRAYLTSKTVGLAISLIVH